MTTPSPTTPSAEALNAAVEKAADAIQAAEGVNVQAPTKVPMSKIRMAMYGLGALALLGGAVGAGVYYNRQRKAKAAGATRPAAADHSVEVSQPGA